MVDSAIICARVNEVLDQDTQEAAAKKLHMAQSTVSKIKTGKQTPTTETLVHIAKEYEVSVDWLLGLSEERKPIKKDEYFDCGNNDITYSTVTKVISLLYRHNIAEISKTKEGRFAIALRDPLLQFLITRCISVDKADPDMLKEWFAQKLSLFDSKPIFYYCPWDRPELHFLSYDDDIQDEFDWLQVYERAKEVDMEFDKLINGSASTEEK